MTFDANQGTGAVPSSVTVNDSSGNDNSQGNNNNQGNGNSNNKITLPSGSGITRTGYTFGGWNTKADGTGTNYQPGNIFTFKANTTLYAKWVLSHTHIWGPWTETTLATCTTAGVETRYCTLDNSHTETQAGAPAFGHDWNEWVVTKPATGVADGEKIRTCKHDPSHVEKETIPKDSNLPGGANNPFHVYDIPTLKKVGTGVDGWVMAAHYFGTVTNCSVTGSIAGVATSIDGSTSGQMFGGVVGINGGTVSYSYATGSVSGSSDIGGVVGYSGSVVNSIALNPSITVMIYYPNSNPPSGIVRLAGRSSSLSNNYARADMIVDNSTVSSSNASSNDGADITASDWNSASWWQNTAKFDPDVWNLVNGKLPTLKNMPGNPVQNPEVK